MPRVEKGLIATWRTGSYSTQDGVTLIELLVALILLTIAAGLATGAIRFGTRDVSVRIVANEIAAELRRVQAQAMGSNTPASFTLDLSERRYVSEGARVVGRIGPDVSIVFRTAASEVTSQTRASLRFYPDGTSTGGEIILRRGGETLTIRINWLSGHISVHEEALTATRQE